MKHSYYEQLIFSESDLSSSEKKILHAHMSDCPRCQKLSEAWGEISPLLMKPEMVSPKADFSSRWMASLQQRADAQKKRSVHAAIWSMAGTAMLCLIVFLGINLNAGNASRFFNRAANFSHDAQQFTTQIRNIIYIAVNKTPPFIWVLLLAAFLGWIAIGGVIWFFIKKNRTKVQYETNR